MCFFFIYLLLGKTLDNTREGETDNLKVKNLILLPRVKGCVTAERGTMKGGRVSGTRRYILSWLKWAREEVASVWTEGGQASGGEAGGVQSERRTCHTVSLSLKTLVCNTWSGDKNLVRFQSFDLLMFWHVRDGDFHIYIFPSRIKMKEQKQRLVCCCCFLCVYF